MVSFGRGRTRARGFVFGRGLSHGLFSREEVRNEPLCLRGQGLLDTLAVRRAYRRRGLGRALLLAGFRVLKKEGMESATLDVDAASLTDATRL